MLYSLLGLGVRAADENIADEDLEGREVAMQVFMTRRGLITLLFVAVAILLRPVEVSAQANLQGDWQGAIALPGTSLQIRVDWKQANGARQGTIDIPQQGGAGLALQAVRFEEPQVHFELQAGQGLATFDGKLDGEKISGDFSQAKRKFSFSLDRKTGASPQVAAAAQSATGSSVPSDSDIRKILIDRIDAQHQSIGIVVGVIGPEGRRVIAYGHLEKGDPRTLNGDTLFEIGSTTKVFTSLLLADMVQHGQVALDDPVAKYLPPGVKLPGRNGRSIELVDLSTHTSGLPRLPTNMTPKDAANPYADYSVEQLYQFLSSYQLTRDIGSQYEYSNLGGGLLGHVLARRAGMDYEALVRSRICDPLEMNSTRIALTPEMKARLAVGHDAGMESVENWDLPTLAGAGALRSTANDLLTFLAANLGYTKSPLAAAMAAMLRVRRPTGQPGLEIALGWHIITANGKEIVWHNGGTGGYRSFVGFEPKTRIGVVALSNAETSVGVDDIGRHLLDVDVPLMKPPKEHKEVKVDPKLFDGYVGSYQLAPSFILTVTREGDHLFAQATAQPKFEIFPESDHDYFLKVVDAQITFVTDTQGRAGELILHQGGRDQHAKRMEGAAPTPKEHKEITVDPKLFDGYVGSYQLAPNFILTVTREGDHLFAQATAQPKFEIFPESDHDYFLKVVDAQITFVTDTRGRANELILHQGGLDQHAKRIE